IVRTVNDEPLRYPSKYKQRTIKVFVEKTDNEWVVVRDARAPFARTLKPRPNLTNMVRRAAHIRIRAVCNSQETSPNNDEESVVTEDVSVCKNYDLKKIRPS
ncbi:hypothetical protein L9F63_007725, partial [Diploptera punctata]